MIPGLQKSQYYLQRVLQRFAKVQWYFSTNYLKVPCRVCGGKTFKEMAYNRIFVKCSSCNFIFSGDFPEFTANIGMGMSGSWGGAEKGGEREDYLVRMLANDYGKKTFLLYGVGSTLAFPVLLQEGFDVYGCDVSEDVIRYRQSQFGKERFFHARELQTKIDRFDAIVACEVFEHFCNPKKWITRIVHSLRKDGIICGTTNFYLGKGIEDTNSIGYMGLAGHVAYWSEQSMEKMFNAFNMALVAFEMICPGSIKPDPKYNLLFPNKRVFFLSSNSESMDKLKVLKMVVPVLPIDTSDYPVAVYK